MSSVKCPNLIRPSTQTGNIRTGDLLFSVQLRFNFVNNFLFLLQPVAKTRVDTKRLERHLIFMPFLHFMVLSSTDGALLISQNN